MVQKMCGLWVSRFTQYREVSNVKTFEIDSQDFLLFFDRALDGMVAILEELGDELANREPDL